MKNFENQLKFVKSVATDNLTRSNIFLAVENGHIRANNPIFAAGCPIDIDLNFAPYADSFWKAVKQCKTVSSLTLNKSGGVEIKSAKLKVTVPCMDLADVAHFPKPSGTPVELNGADLSNVLKTALPFVHVDNTRPWANSVMLQDGYAYATNNTSIIRIETGFAVPRQVSIPLVAVKEVVKHKYKIDSLRVDEKSVTFGYENGYWLRSLTYEMSWPDLQNVLHVDCTPHPIPDDFFEALRTCAEFKSDGVVELKDGEMVHKHDLSGEVRYKVEGLPKKGAYSIKLLSNFEGTFTDADFNTYSDKAVFTSEGVLGVLMCYHL